MTNPVALFGQSHNGYKGDQRHRVGSLGLIAGPGVEPRYLRGYGPRMVIRSTHPHRKSNGPYSPQRVLLGFSAHMPDSNRQPAAFRRPFYHRTKYVIRFSCLGTARTYNLSVRTTIAFATIAVCGLDCVFTISFLT